MHFAGTSSVVAQPLHIADVMRVRHQADSPTICARSLLKRSFTMLTSIAAVACLTFSAGELPCPTSINPVELTVAPLAESATGTISNVDSAKKIFTLNTKSGNIEVKISDSTEFTLDGKAASMADAIKIGREATVSHENRVASRVDVKSEK
jgi:hypothetical protein